MSKITRFQNILALSVLTFSFCLGTVNIPSAIANDTTTNQPKDSGNNTTNQPKDPSNNTTNQPKDSGNNTTNQTENTNNDDPLCPSGKFVIPEIGKNPFLITGNKLIQRWVINDKGKSQLIAFRFNNKGEAVLEYSSDISYDVIRRTAKYEICDNYQEAKDSPIAINIKVGTRELKTIFKIEANPQKNTEKILRIQLKDARVGKPRPQKLTEERFFKVADK